VSEYPLPKDTTDALTHATAATKAIADGGIANFGLFFHRCIQYSQGWQLESDAKTKAWKEQVKPQAARIFADPYMRELFRSVQRRLNAVVEGYRRRSWAVGSFAMAVDWRLAIGFSAPSVLDTGIALHRVYGIPYLPGSAIKGLTRHVCLSEIADALGVSPLDPEKIKGRKERRNPEEKETPWEMLEQVLIAEENDRTTRERFERLKTDPEVQDLATGVRRVSLAELRSRYGYFRHVFGSTDQQGAVIFLDAFPEVSTGGRVDPLLELDIINTHYQEYYTDPRKKTPPADYLSPKPVLFLTVRSGTPFRFRLIGQDTDALGKAQDGLKKALQQFGIGAKTAAGYGALHPVA
jgi:CRISPR-associated protein Cmr6